MMSLVCGFFFFFKQKTAYEMRISDWSSDVCSSDLLEGDELPDECRDGVGCQAEQRRRVGHRHARVAADDPHELELGPGEREVGKRSPDEAPGPQIGRASCRERVCQYV